MTSREVCSRPQAELKCSVWGQAVRIGSTQDSVSDPTVWSIASKASATWSQVQHDDMGLESAPEHGLMVQP